MKTARLALIAYWLGVKDGWRQPYDLIWSTNAWPLVDRGLDEDVAFETLDLGINLGQFLRAGRRSQSWREGFRLRPRLSDFIVSE